MSCLWSGLLLGRPEARADFFLSVRAESRSRIFKAATAASFWTSKKKSLVLALGMNLDQFLKINMIQCKKITNKPLVSGAKVGAAWSYLFLSRARAGVWAEAGFGYRTLARPSHFTPALDPAPTEMSRLRLHNTVLHRTVSHLLSPVSCLPSPIFHFLSAVSCFPSPIFCLPSPVSCLPSFVSCLPSPVFCLLYPVYCLTSPTVFYPNFIVKKRKEENPELDYDQQDGYTKRKRTPKKICKYVRRKIDFNVIEKTLSEMENGVVKKKKDSSENSTSATPLSAHQSVLEEDKNSSGRKKTGYGVIDTLLGQLGLPLKEVVKNHELKGTRHCSRCRAVGHTRRRCKKN